MEVCAWLLLLGGGREFATVGDIFGNSMKLFYTELEISSIKIVVQRPPSAMSGLISGHQMQC